MADVGMVRQGNKRYRRQGDRRRSARIKGGAAASGLIPAEEELRTILAIVKALTGNDFTSYKKESILRSIERRMAINGIDQGRGYIVYLVQNPMEVQLLCQEFKVSVTGFFRDPEAFDVLRHKVIPPLIAEAGMKTPIRIWNVRCATGEEAYSIAILMREQLDRLESSARVQIFATDIDKEAVTHAKAGLYSDNVVSSMDENRLGQFFTRSEGHWQVCRGLREMIIFAHHRILRDPPFSKLNFIVCCNFLAYLNIEMQRWLISLFHTVLKPGGFLFLGPSETPESDTVLFAPVDRHWRIYERVACHERRDPFHPFSYSMWKVLKPPPPGDGDSASNNHSLAAAQQYLTSRYAPPCVLVNEKYEVLHFLSNVRGYLTLPSGEPTLDLLKMVKPELRSVLRALIDKAISNEKEVFLRQVKVTLDSGKTAVNVLVSPIIGAPYYEKLAMIVLEPASDRDTLVPVYEGSRLSEDREAKDALIRQLEEQLCITQEQLQTTSEQLETSNEGFMTANEELMSMNEEFEVANEELQATNEELESSREEMEVLNDRITAVNLELQNKVEELNSINIELESFIYSISHDLKGPLRTIAGFSDILIQRYAGKLDDMARDYLYRIEKGAETMTQFIQDLLRLSGISKQEMNPKEVDLSTMAAAILSELRENQPDRKVAVDIQEGLSARVDPALFRIMLSNLLRNAWKFTGENPEAHIAFGTVEGNGNRTYYVRDNGVGFDPAYAEKMFWPFHRLHASDAFEGTGIGLAIVERVIRRHGG
jgi:two-component system, chemotaxis family, CheB/CheR fusion protein